MQDSKKNNADNTDNSVTVGGNQAKVNRLLITKSEFFFSLFSVIMPFLCYFPANKICEFFSFSGAPSDLNSCLVVFLIYNIVIESIYTSLYGILINKSGLNRNIFIANTIILILIAFLPAFGLIYAFGGFIFIVPVICFWFINIIKLIKFIYNASRLFRLCIFGVLIYLIIAIISSVILS